MAITKPIRAKKVQPLNARVKEQDQIWDIESNLELFGRALDTLDVISDGLVDDSRTANAIIGVHDNLSNIHAELTARLLG